jgi:hypothetical protein
MNFFKSALVHLGILALALLTCSAAHKLVPVTHYQSAILISPSLPVPRVVPTVAMRSQGGAVVLQVTRLRAGAPAVLNATQRDAPAPAALLATLDTTPASEPSLPVTANPLVAPPSSLNWASLEPAL